MKKWRNGSIASSVNVSPDNKRIWRDHGVIGTVIVLALAALFFGRAIWGSDLTLIWDAADYAYPFMAFSGHFFRLGVAPLWNSFIFNGYPSFADPQAQTFYPINLAIAMMSDFSPRVVYLQIIFHHFLAGLFMFVLCKRFGYPMFASLLAAIAYMFSGYMVGHFSHILIYAAAWLPLALLVLDAAMKNCGPSWIVAGGLVLGVLILSGPIQTIFYVLFVLGMHWLYRSMMAYRANHQVSGVASNAGILVGMVSLGVLLAMVQLLPTAEFVAQTTRSEVRSLASAGYGIPVQNLFTLAMPNYFGGITEPYWGRPDITQQNLYMGVAPLFLAGLVLLFRRTAWTFYLTGMALLSLLISMGENTPVFAFFYYWVPGFSYFRSALHFLFVFHFFLALLAAEGAVILFDERAAGRVQLLYSILFMLAVCAIYWALPQPPSEVSSRYTLEGAYRFAGLFGILGFMVVMSRIKRVTAITKAILVIFVFADLWLISGRSVTLGLPMDPARLEQQEMFAELIKRDAGLVDTDILYHTASPNLEESYLTDGLFRIYVHPPGREYRVPDDINRLSVFGYNRSILQQLFFVDGYSPLILQRHQESSGFIGGRALTRYLDLSNVRYVVNYGKLVDVNELDRFMPRALIVGNAEFIVDKNEVLSRLSDPSFDPHSTVILETRKNQTGNKSPIQSRVNFIRYEPNMIEMGTVSDQNGYLLLNETYYRGWRAFVDGVESTVYRANYEYKAIELPSGSHRVRFAFRPVSLQIGLAVTLVTFVGSLLYLWFLVGRAGRRTAKDT